MSRRMREANNYAAPAGVFTGSRNAPASTLNRAHNLAICALLGSLRFPPRSSDAALLLASNLPNSVTLIRACSTNIPNACVGDTSSILIG